METEKATSRPIGLGAKVLLAVSGLTALAIGLFLFAVPIAFYGSNGIELAHDAGLLSDLRGSGAVIFAAGIFVSASLFQNRLAPVAMALAAGLYLAYGAARLVSFGLDGVPPNGILAATVLEIVMGLLCLAAFRRMARPATT